jgi:hypothetical protein
MDDVPFRPFLALDGKYPTVLTKYSELPDPDYRPVTTELGELMGKKRKAVQFLTPQAYESVGSSENMISMTSKDFRGVFGDPKKQEKETKKKPTIITPGNLMDFEDEYPSRAKGNKPGHKLKELLEKALQQL